MISSSQLKNALHTRFHIFEDPFIHPKSNMVFLGSCFSEEISQRFHDRFMPSYFNPFGTLFTPNAILNCLEIIAGIKPIEILQRQELHYFLDGAARFQNKNADLLRNQIATIALEAKQHLQKADVLFITLGTAFYYEYLPKAKPVANCHKIPQKDFLKKRFDTQEIQTDLSQMYSLVEHHFPGAKLVFTISPVRHLRDGIAENVHSKALLKVALAQFMEQHPNCRYFPSYEIFNEELRDFRFFKNDLMHPNEWSSDYIFTRLIETYADPSLLNYLNKAEPIRKKHIHDDYKALSSINPQLNWHEHRSNLLSSVEIV